MPSKKCQRCGKWHKSKKQQKDCFRIQKLHLSEAVDLNIIRNQQVLERQEMNNELLKQNILKCVESPFAIQNGNQEIVNNSPHTKYQIASIMKLLTLLTCCRILKQKQIPFQTIVTVPYLKLFQGQTKMNLQNGQKISIFQLFMGTILVSGGDAAQTLSYFVGNLYQNTDPHIKFLELMKQTALIEGIDIKIVDCRGVKYGNICDLNNTIKLLKALRKYKKVRKIFQIKTKKIKVSKNQKIFYHALSSTNPFISSKIYGKTGTTQQFNTNFVGYYQKDIRIFYFCIFDCKKGERDITIKRISTFIKGYGQQYE